MNKKFLSKVIQLSTVCFMYLSLKKIVLTLCMVILGCSYNIVFAIDIIFLILCVFYYRKKTLELLGNLDDFYKKILSKIIQILNIYIIYYGVNKLFYIFFALDILKDTVKIVNIFKLIFYTLCILLCVKKSLELSRELDD